MITTADVAERLSCSRKHVNNLITSGRLPAVKVGGMYRVELDDLTRFLRRNRTTDL
jgi:excisionase family DNA binding protein